MARIPGQIAPSHIIGSSGVDLFFIIGGFIMLITTHDKDIDTWAFFRLRIIRVVPMYWLCTMAMVILWLSGHLPNFPRITPETLAKSLLFIPTVGGARKVGRDSHRCDAGARLIRLLGSGPALVFYATIKSVIKSVD